MKMNSYYTHISQKSYDAYVRDRTNLDQVLCALIVDPDEATDAAKEYGLELPHSLEGFQSYSLKFVEMMKQTIAQWVMTHRHSKEAIIGIARWNRRLATVCACAVARYAQRYLNSTLRDKSETLLRAAESCLDGKVSTYRLGQLVSMSFPPSNTPEAAWVAAMSSSRAAATPYADEEMPAAAISYAARAMYLSKEAASESSALSSLREVVANACLTFPG